MTDNTPDFKHVPPTPEVPSPPAFDLQKELMKAEGMLQQRLADIQCEIAEKFSDLLKARLDKHLGRQSEMKDWAKCSIQDGKFCFEEKALMEVIVSVPRWTSDDTMRQEIKYVDL